MGLPIDSFTADQLVEHLMAKSRLGMGGYLMTPNVDNLRTVTRSAESLKRALRADIRVADGMPLIWASRIQGTPLPGRIAGSDLIFSIAESTAVSGQRLFLLGGNPGTARRAASGLCERFEGLNVVGTYCPPLHFERDPEELERIRREVSRARPHFVYLGLPFDKASALAADLRSVLPGAWFIGLGISFSFVCGDVSRAPVWMQRSGLEWLHRLAQEPGRLVRRYLIEGFPFVLRLMLSAFVNRLQLPRPGGARF